MRASVLKVIPDRALKKDHTLARCLLDKGRASGTPFEYLGSEEDLQAMLENYLDYSRKSWPKFQVSDESFVGYISGLLEKDMTIPLALRAIEGEDLWLVHACLQRDSSAIQELELLLRYTARKIGADREMSRDGRDEFLQHLRAALMVSKDGTRPPLLASYAGRGSFKGWLRVVMTREMVQLSKHRKREVELSSTIQDAFLVEEKNPEIRTLRQEHGQVFKEVFRAAIERLNVEDRLLLSYWIVQELTLEQIGTGIDAHRSTVARRISKLRNRLLMHLEIELTQRLKLRQCELESVMRCIESHMDASLSILASKYQKAVRKGSK